MSYWYEPKEEDIDMTEDGKEIHVYLDNDEFGARYVSLKTSVIKKIINKNPDVLNQDCGN